MTDTQHTTEHASTIGSFADVALDGSDDPVAKVHFADVDEAIDSLAAANGYSTEQVVWSTPEHIDVKPIYTRADRDAVTLSLIHI